MQKLIRVLHIDVDKKWRGGQQQAFYLHQYLSSQNIFSLMVCNKKSIMADKCERQKLTFNTIKYRNELDIFSAIKIFQICKKNNINIIVAHSSHALSIGLLTKLIFGKLNLIAIRRVDFSIRNNLLSTFKYKTNLLNRIVCVSDFIKQVMSIDKEINSKLMTIRDCIDVSKYMNIASSINLKKELELTSSSIIIGSTAAFVGHKDYPNLIRAAKIVIEKYHDTIFICVGDGELKSKIETMVNNFGLIKNFRFTGFKKNVISYIKLFDIFVLSSKMEGLGSSILEAKAIGLPIVATKTGGIPEIVNNEYDGILVEPKNSEALAETIIRLIENKEERNMLAKNALKSIQLNDIRSYGEKYLELFYQLVHE